MTNRSNKTSGGRSSSASSRTQSGSQASQQSSEDRKDLSGSQGQSCPSDMTSISNDDEEEE